jgi:hypothetical protein
VDGWVGGWVGGWVVGWLVGWLAEGFSPEILEACKVLGVNSSPRQLLEFQSSYTWVSHFVQFFQKFQASQTMGLHSPKQPSSHFTPKITHGSEFFEFYEYMYKNIHHIDHFCGAHKFSERILGVHDEAGKCLGLRPIAFGKKGGNV